MDSIPVLYGWKCTKGVLFLWNIFLENKKISCYQREMYGRIGSSKSKGDNSMAMMTVYHGGYMTVEKPEIRVERNTKDFGNGFYCTVIKEQAQRWARRYDKKIVSIYDVQFRQNLCMKEFKDMSDEWLDFIIACRSGESHDYDIVIGAMADDQIYNYVSDYMDGTITREQFWVLAKFKYPTHQITFCTETALECLTYRGYEEVTTQ